MPWSAPTSSDDVVAIHAALVPTANGDGEILLFGGDNHDLQASEQDLFDHARRFNCRHPTQPLVYVHSPDFDLFCSGHATLGDGRILVAGGTAEFPADAAGPHHNLHFDGHRHAVAYRPTVGAFAAVADMNREPGNTAQDSGGRWYPTLCTLATGEVLAFQGHPGGGDHRHGNNTPERYQPLTGSWTLLPPVGTVGGGPVLYPRLHALPDGEVFVSTPTPGFTRCISYNPWTGTAREVAPVPDPAYHGFARPAVLLPLHPEDGYRARVLVCGGTPSQVIDLGDGSPTWTTVPRSGSAATRDRKNCHATLLPTGDVLITGGTDDSGDQNGVMQPELYHNGAWQTVNEPATVLRNYHSTALLLPDGRVWTAGGNSPNQPGQPPTATQKQIEIYEPPYPAGPRPQITSAPGFLGYGDSFTVHVTGAAPITRVVLMRCGSATHAFNPDQRAVILEHDTSGANTLAVTAPPTGGVAPPGYYLLFVVDAQGRPCQYARFVRVGGRLSMFTGRNQLSLHEIQALLSGSNPAFVPQAFFVVLDGFSAQDLASTDRPFPPQVQFHFSDNNQVVPGLTADFVDALYDNPGAAPETLQRITLQYRYRFTDTHAFDGIAAGAEREIRIDVAWGPSRTSGVLSVFRHEHVYALDGPVPWLSIDTRVVRVPRHTVRAGIRDDDPVGYVQQAVNHFRSLPNDEFHPFAQLPTDQAVSALELSPTVGGVPVDNFAFAKVRFRAPNGVHADDVKMFFRLFTTAVTNLNYDDTTVYRRAGNGPNAVALAGTVGGETASIPFFASPRHTNPNTQPDPTNVVSLTGTGAAEVVTYFGCWLDFNQNDTIRNQIRGRHQCLVAEIHYPPSPIARGVSPANSDQLSQRNLAFVTSDNPGGPAAHTVTHTFELRPSSALKYNPTTVRAFVAQRGGPDELFLHWHHLPPDTVATVYLPGVDLTDSLTMAAYLSQGDGGLALIDEHTVRCRVGDASYLPIPGSDGPNLAGLLTIQLPPTVRAGELYRVSAHQVSGSHRTITGSFEVAIPVSTAGEIVAAEQRDLAVLRQIGGSIPAGNRWEPVFARYLDVLTDRVRAFGGDPEHSGEPDDEPDTAGRVTGKVAEICYDCFGDFAGFVLETCDGQRRYHATERRLHDLLHEAARDRLSVTVSADREDRVHSVDVHYH